MNGETITQTVLEELTYDSLHETENNLWSILLMTGYLTKANPDQQGDTVDLRIPNTEIASIFQDTVAKYFSDHLDDTAQKSLMEAFWSGDDEAASTIISDLLINQEYAKGFDAYQVYCYGIAFYQKSALVKKLSP